MRRTNIYLDERQLQLLRLLSEEQGVPVAQLVRAAVDNWLESQGVRAVSEDEWQRRFTTLLDRRRRLATERQFDPAEVEEAVRQAIAEMRAGRSRARGG